MTLDEIIKVLTKISPNTRQFDHCYHLTEDRLIYTDGYILLDLPKPIALPTDYVGTYNFNGTPKAINYPSYTGLTYDNDAKWAIDLSMALEVSKLVKPMGKHCPYVAIDSGKIYGVKNVPSNCLQLEYLHLAQKLIKGEITAYQQSNKLIKLSNQTSHMYISSTIERN